MNFRNLLTRIEQLELGPSDTLEVPPPELVAFVVRIARGLRQLKQSTLADFAGVSLATIERVERGEKVSGECLNKIAVALGYGSGYFTAPRCRKSVEAAAAELCEEYGHLEPVSVGPLRTHSQLRAIASCHATLVHRPELPEEYDAEVGELLEWLDLASFLLGEQNRANSKDRRRRELYGSILDCVRRLESRGGTVLAGVMSAPQEGIPDWKVSVISVTRKSADPGALKRKHVFVDRRAVALPQMAHVQASRP